MASKNLWIAELQNRDGKTVEYHSVDLEQEHYASRSDFNRAMTSWSAFRQRERGNLKCNRPRNSRCKWAVSWHPEDDAMYHLLGLPENIKHHKTIWDLYEAIGYNYKAKKYERDATVVAIDPGSEDSAIEATFEDEKLVQVRTLEPEAKTVTEQKRMRGDVPGLLHIDESGFIDDNGVPIYTVTGNGRKTEFLNEHALFIPKSSDPESTQETPQCDDSGLAISSSNPGVWQEGPANEITLSLADDKTAQYTVKLDGNSFTVRSSDLLPLAQQIADKVNAEPDIEAKKRIIDAEMRYYHSEQERLADAQRIKNAIIMPNDPRKLAKVRAHKLAVVAKHQKLLRKQEKRQKQRELQVKAFNGK